MIAWSSDMPDLRFVQTGSAILPHGAGLVGCRLGVKAWHSGSVASPLPDPRPALRREAQLGATPDGHTPVKSERLFCLMIAARQHAAGDRAPDRRESTVRH